MTEFLWGICGLAFVVVLLVLCWKLGQLYLFGADAIDAANKELRDRVREDEGSSTSSYDPDRRVYRTAYDPSRWPNE